MSFAGIITIEPATIEDAGLVEEWYQFKHDALKAIVREVLEELGVPYK